MCFEGMVCMQFKGQNFNLNQFLLKIRRYWECVSATYINEKEYMNDKVFFPVFSSALTSAQAT